MRRIDFAAIRERVTIDQVLELLEFESRGQTGHQLRGACPVHGSTGKRSRTFSVNTAKKTFQCFKCGAKGNHLDLWAQVNDLSVYDAAIDLCRRLGLEPPVLK